MVAQAEVAEVDARGVVTPIVPKTVVGIVAFVGPALKSGRWGVDGGDISAFNDAPGSRVVGVPGYDVDPKAVRRTPCSPASSCVA